MSSAFPKRIVLGEGSSNNGVMLRAVIYGAGALAISGVLLFMKGEGAPGMTRIGVISFVIFLAVTLEVHALVFRGARGGRNIVLDAAGLGGEAVFNAPEKRISWDRVREIEQDGQALVVTVAPLDMTSRNPEDRRSKFRLAIHGVSADELEAAVRRFWKTGEGG